jgi:putative hydrolase of the HAD superfamily
LPQSQVNFFGGPNAIMGYMLKTVFFDMYGTIAGFEPSRFKVQSEACAPYGIGVAVSTNRALEIWRVVQVIPHSLAPFDDVIPAMEQLRARGLTIGLITNMDGKGSDIVDDLGLSDHIDLAVTSGETGATKPSSTIFRAALAKAGAEPDEAMHVGDQPSSDIEGALGVGMGAVLLDRDRNHPGYTACPRIESLVELAALVDGQG